MHAVLATALVAVGAFLGTMVDNFVAFAAQAALTEERRHQRIGSGHFFGVVVLVIIACGVATALAEIPLRWIGILAIIPLALALHAWRTRAVTRPVTKRGWTTTLLMTIGLGGDNLAVWVPLLRAGGLARGVMTTGIFLLLDLALISIALFVARRPRVMALSQRFGPALTPVLYVGLAVVILWQCHWF